MKKKSFQSLFIGLLAFFLTFLVTFLMESPSPFWAGLVAGFLVFEISYYHFFYRKNMQNQL